MKSLNCPWFRLKSLKSPVKTRKYVSILDLWVFFVKSIKSPVNTWKYCSILEFSVILLKIIKVTGENLKIPFNPWIFHVFFYNYWSHQWKLENVVQSSKFLWFFGYQCNHQYKLENSCQTLNFLDDCLKTLMSLKKCKSTISDEPRTNSERTPTNSKLSVPKIT